MEHASSVSISNNALWMAVAMEFTNVILPKRTRRKFLQHFGARISLEYSTVSVRMGIPFKRMRGISTVGAHPQNVPLILVKLFKVPAIFKVSMVIGMGHFIRVDFRGNMFCPQDQDSWLVLSEAPFQISDGC